MTRPELASPSPSFHVGRASVSIFAPHQREGVWPLPMIWRAAGPIHGGSSVESGFEPGTLRSQSRYLTTRPPLSLREKETTPLMMHNNVEAEKVS
ncbi:hypothetical protein AVEN_270029-1 [Araneus ventricosus]|uniref:Uncharacterized protein n=1 Tax=Araneus ventricosus TaxID=182803 RepID=A0A4Y2VMD1_ARAVE|nr:hypothetical protein AVEN_32728-1 [Araneus ventricosus]GBO26485.1 hypothetical protein AVEN_153968-1 [Araneus ventricosus]GBO26493.1 hypothetical protein AVEN_270029-1 [Araneus ventricosus]